MENKKIEFGENSGMMLSVLEDGVKVVLQTKVLGTDRTWSMSLTLDLENIEILLSYLSKAKTILEGKISG